MAFELDATTTALVLIDLEHGIVGRDLAPYTGKEVVSKCAGLSEVFRKAGGTVVYVHVLLHEIERHEADQSTMPKDAPKPPKEASELVPEAGYQEGKDILIVKRQWGAFYGTPLDLLLRRKGIRTVVMAGIATNIGVESTARAAIEHGYDVVFAEDAMTTFSAEAQRGAIEGVFRLIGRVRTAAEVEEALRR